MPISTPFGGLMLGSLLAAGACWALVYAVLLTLGGRTQRIRRRLKDFTVADVAAPDASAGPSARAVLFSQFDRRLARLPFFRGWAADVRVAALRVTMTEMLLALACVGVAGVILAPRLDPDHAALLVLAGLGGGLGVLRFGTHWRVSQRRSQFDGQLASTLTVMATAVRGGASIFQALQLIAQDSPEPSRSEFLQLTQEIRLGVPLDNALEALAARVPTEDVDMLVTAISLQHQTGGNLSHILDVVAQAVRERHRIKRQVRAITSQQRVSANVLAAIPFILTGLLFIISPNYIAPLFAPGLVMLIPIGAFILAVIGYVLMLRIGGVDA